MPIRGEFKDAAFATGLVSERPGRRRWADQYGCAIRAKPKANLHQLQAETWEEAYALLIQYQCLGDIDGDFADEEDEMLCQNQHDEARDLFNTYGYVECQVYNSLSSVIVERT